MPMVMLALVLTLTTAWAEADKLFFTPKVNFATTITKIEIVELKPKLEVDVKLSAIKDTNKFLNDNTNYILASSSCGIKRTFISI